MAAAYAALMSLMHTSELILHPSKQWLRLHRNQIESLLQKVRLLQEFLEDYSHRGHEEMAGLESRIANIAYAAEDIIESHVLDQVLARSTGSEAKSSTSFSEYIQKLIEEMEDLIKNKVLRIKANVGDFEESRMFADSSHAVSSRLGPNEQNTLVGSDKMLIEIMDTLTGQQKNRQIISIVGMGGIGKTALAKNVFEKPYITHYFYIRAWVTISQNHSAEKIILALLSEINRSEQEPVPSDDPLGAKLHKSLFGKRYLIVMDDLWRIEAWDEIRAFFPDNCNGSRIMITTRQSNLARQLSSIEPFELKFLDGEQSWELLCDKVFGKEGCPFELEVLGKDIARKCEGLPLAIVVIGGLLAKSNMTREFWKYVLENLNSIMNSEVYGLKILYLSYKNLPIHLKPCFLYTAAYVEDSWVSVRPHIKVLVAEGFLKPIRGKSLEEVGYEYITDLIDRNLIYVYKRGNLGRLKGIAVHDLLRDLCLREVEKENFICVIDKHNLDIPLEIKSKRRLFFNQPPKKSTTQVLDLLRSASATRTMRGDFGWTTSLAPSIRLLRVLNNLAEDFPPKDTEIMQLVNLRLMGILSKWEWETKLMWTFTSSMSQFWNLQTLHVRGFSNKPIFLPPEIWDLPQLRHLRFSRVVLPDPSCSHYDEHDSHILENLQTLSTVQNFRWTKEVLKRLPNLKKLNVIYEHDWPLYCLKNLVHLHKLESLKFCALDLISLTYVSFPLSLKELTLNRCRLPWEDMTIVGSLPNLEALEVECHAFEGQTWCPKEDQFVRLKLLDIAKTDLLHWRADKTHFQILEHLILDDLNLEEFPEDFGEHVTLKKIEVFSCNDSTNTWAEQVREEQESSGNNGLQVIVHKREDN